MTDRQPAPGRNRASADSTTRRRRSRPAAASRILVTGLSVATTLGLATAMATPDAPDIEPSTTPEDDSGIAVPAAVPISATEQPAVTTSHAS